MNLLYALPLLALVLSGCVVRTYPLVRDRVDQELDAGNRGFIQGQGPDATDRKSTRTTRIVEIELHPPVKFEKGSARHQQVEPQADDSISRDSTQDKQIWGNRGYITQSDTPEILETSGSNFQNYTVGKNDTLQKISQKFYGTTKNWIKIYEANKDTLKGPNKIYPGQVIRIPQISGQSAMIEPKENLK